MSEPTKPDWADEKAAELLPCETPPGWTCGHPFPSHSATCPVRFRDAFAAKFREVRAQALEEAAEIVERTWHTSGTTCEDRENCGIVIHHRRSSDAAAAAIRKLEAGNG